MEIEYYYPTYRPSINSYFRIKPTAIGHLVNKEGNLLCGELKRSEETFESFEIIDYAKPGVRLCEKCKTLRASTLTWPPTVAENVNLQRKQDLAKLERWNDAVKNRGKQIRNNAESRGF